MWIKQELKRIYSALSDGQLSQDEALERIRALKRQELERNEVFLSQPRWIEERSSGVRIDRKYAQRYVLLCEPGEEVLQHLDAQIGRAHV